MIPMWVVWIVRAIWAMTFVFWCVCLVRWFKANRDYRKARERLLPEIERLTREGRGQ